MDRTTQQNAALVEEAAAASESLREQAEKLTQVVAVFKLGGMQNSIATMYSAPATKVRTNVTPLHRKTAVAAATSSDPLQVKHLATAGNGNDWEEF